MNLTRRTALFMSLAACATARAAAPRAEPPFEALAQLERRAGGRLGVAVLDVGTGQAWAHRGDERFGMCSTFKLPLAAATLARIDAGTWQGADTLLLRPQDIVGHAPITRARVKEGRMSLMDLAQAAQTHSDNGAANLLLRHLGGPAALTAWLRTQDDATTRIDRMEPEMNHVVQGDLRDTTTPAAMAALTARLVVGDSLLPANRERLVGWMRATETGLRRLRAGLPANWMCGDKTGTGMSPDMPDRYNDVAVCWPPGRAPLVIAAYYEGPHRNSERIRPEAEAVLADAGRLVAAQFTS